MKKLKKAISSIVPSKKTFDLNGDGKVDHNDLKDAVLQAAIKVTPSKSSFDVNGDGVVDHKDAVVGAKIAGAAVVGAGATVGAGAYAGALIVSGTATSIATGVVAIAGAAVGSFLGVVLGTTSTAAYAVIQTTSGVLVVASKASTVSPALVSAFSSIGSGVGAMNSTLVAKVAGMKVVESLAISSAVANKGVIVILGVPIAREVALAAGLLSIVIVGGYAYFLLNQDATREEIAELAAAPS